MKYFKHISVSMVVSVIVLMPLISLAQEGGTPPPPKPTPVSLDIKIDNPFRCDSGKDCTLLDVLTAILNRVVMPIAAIFVTFWIIFAGFKYVMAQGKPEEIKKAHQTLLWSLIGAGILLGAAGISQVVQHTVTGLIKP